MAAWNLGVRINNYHRCQERSEESKQSNSCDVVQQDYWPDWIAAATIAYGLHGISMNRVAWIILAPSLMIMICLLIYRGSSIMRMTRI